MLKDTKDLPAHFSRLDAPAQLLAYEIQDLIVACFALELTFLLRCALRDQLFPGFLPRSRFFSLFFCINMNISSGNLGLFFFDLCRSLNHE